MISVEAAEAARKRKMKILVTGSTGFTGERVLPLLLGKGAIRCLVRPSSGIQKIEEIGYELSYGNLCDLDSLKRAMSGCDVLINIASLGFGHAPGIVNIAEKAGITRAIFVSTTALFTQVNAKSKSVRQQAEDCIKTSKLDWTILRPTMIYGASGDRNMCRLIRYLQRWPFIPIFGNGRYLQHPVYVEDVAKALVDALMTERTIGKSYNIAGAKAVTFNEVIDTICQLLGRRVLKVHHIPASPVVKGLSAAERLGLELPIKAEQILRLNENKAFDCNEAAKDFGYSPRSFFDGITIELREMGINVLEEERNPKYETIA